MPVPFQPHLSHAEVENVLPSLTVVDHLGEGGQGVAFKVNSAEHGLCALKVYGPAVVSARVDKEIDKLLRLDSDYLVRLYDHGEVPLRGQQCRFALMEFIDGQEVSSLVGAYSHGDLDQEVRQLIRNTALGIKALWELRVVHRDLKPANVMRRSDGNYVILDLGLAKHLDETTLTQAGFTCGTFGYMSPEQAAGRRGLTFRSDLFALGLLAYEFATGSHPYYRNQQLVGILDVPPLSSVRPSISEDVSKVVAQLMRLKVLDRPKRVADILDALT